MNCRRHLLAAARRKVGCLILGVLTNGMQMVGLDINSQYVVKGIILMASIGYDTFQQQAKVRKAAKKA